MGLGSELGLGLGLGLGLRSRLGAGSGFDEAAAHGEVDCEVLGDAQQPLPICHHGGSPSLPHEHRLRHGEHGEGAGDARGLQPQGEGQAEQELRHAEAKVVVPVAVIEGGEGCAQ